MWSPPFPKVCVVLPGTPGCSLDLFLLDKGTESPNSIISKKLLNHNNIICLQEVRGKDEFLQAIQVLAPRFRLFGTFLLDNENAGGSAICIPRDLLPHEAIVTHLIPCHGRGHFVTNRTERYSLVIVSVHFEPELTLRQLRGRLGLIHPHWPAYPNGVDTILGDFNICDPEKRTI